MTDSMQVAVKPQIKSLFEAYGVIIQNTMFSIAFVHFEPTLHYDKRSVAILRSEHSILNMKIRNTYLSSATGNRIP